MTAGALRHGNAIETRCRNWDSRDSTRQEGCPSAAGFRRLLGFVPQPNLPGLFADVPTPRFFPPAENGKRHLRKISPAFNDMSQEPTYPLFWPFFPIGVNPTSSKREHVNLIACFSGREPMKPNLSSLYSRIFNVSTSTIVLQSPI